MSKEEIIARLKALQGRFDPDDCIDFAVAAMELIDQILAAEEKA